MLEPTRHVLVKPLNHTLYVRRDLSKMFSVLFGFQKRHALDKVNIRKE
jgi:hypothetical protein